MKEKGYFQFKLYSDVYGCEDLSHVHCEICWQVITNDNWQDTVNNGYYSNDTWVCNQCYLNFVEPDNYLDAIVTLEKVAEPQ